MTVEYFQTWWTKLDISYNMTENQDAHYGVHIENQSTQDMREIQGFLTNEDAKPAGLVQIVKYGDFIDEGYYEGVDETSVGMHRLITADGTTHISLHRGGE